MKRLILLFCLVLAACSSGHDNQKLSKAEQFERTVLESDAKVWLKVLEEEFPEEYAATRAELRRLGELGTVSDEDALAFAMNEETEPAPSSLVYASDSQLAVLADLQYSLYDTIGSSNLQACVDLMNGSPPTTAQIDALQLNEAMANFRAQRLLAIAEGRDHPVTRNLASEAELNSFSEDVFRELQNSGELLTSDTTSESTEDRELCSWTLALQRTIAELPDAESAFWYASLNNID